MDEFAFEERYRPILDSNGAWRDFSWAEPADQEQIAVAHNEDRIWTTVDIGGFVMVTAGRHFVNRLGYVITERAFERDAEIVVYDQEEYEEWEAGLAKEEFAG
jgi:hypothetical protein